MKPLLKKKAEQVTEFKSPDRKLLPRKEKAKLAPEILSVSIQQELDRITNGKVVISQENGLFVLVEGDRKEFVSDLNIFWQMIDGISPVDPTDSDDLAIDSIWRCV